jgi:hypothetical protein
MTSGFVQTMKSLFQKKGGAAGVLPMLAVWNASFQTVMVNQVAVPKGAGTVLLNVSVSASNVAPDAPAYFGSLTPKLLPRSPRFAAAKSASQIA